MSLMLILAALYITLILFLAFTIIRIKKRNNELEYNHQSNIIKYVEFNKEGIKVCYPNNQINKIIYENISEMNLSIKTEMMHSYGSSMLLWYSYRYIGVTGIILKIKYNDDKISKDITINLPACFTLIDKIFKIIYFSQYIPNFSCKLPKQHESELQKTLRKAIKSYIANNYKHTFRSFGYSIWAIPVLTITIMLLFIVLFIIGYLIVIGGI